MEEFTLLDAARMIAPVKPQIETEVTDFLWAIVRLLKPDIVIETGCSAGLATVAMTNALYLNGKGILLGFESDPEKVELIRGKVSDTPGIAAITSVPLEEALSNFAWPENPRVFAFLKVAAHVLNFLIRNYFKKGDIIAMQGDSQSGSCKTVLIPTFGGLTIAEIL